MKNSALIVMMAISFLAGRNIAQPDHGPALENAYIQGWEAREQEFISDMADIAGDIHGRYGVPIPERKPR